MEKTGILRCNVLQRKTNRHKTNPSRSFNWILNVYLSSYQCHDFMRKFIIIATIVIGRIEELILHQIQREGNFTCMLSRKPAWLKELKLRAAVRKAAAIAGVLANLKQSKDTPGPTKPIDCNTRYSWFLFVLMQLD